MELNTAICKIRGLNRSLKSIDSKFPLYLIVVGSLGISYFTTYLTPMSEILINWFALIFAVGGLVFYFTGSS